MMVLAVVRPDDWNLPLLVHVAGAMLVVGFLAASAYMLLLGGDSVAMQRLGYRTLLLGALPAYIVMRGGAQWVLSREGYGDADPTWIGIGFGVTDVGALLLVIALILGGIGVRRLRTADARNRLLTATGVLAAVLLAAYLVAVWAMTVKPD